MVICQSTSVGETFSDMLLSFSSCLVRCPLPTLPQFNDCEVIFLNVTSSQLMELSFLAVTFDLLSIERWKHFLTRIEVIRGAYCFEHCVAMRKKPIITETVNFLLFVCIVEAFNFTLWCRSLKTRHDKFSKLRVLLRRGVNLLVFESRSQ